MTKYHAQPTEYDGRRYASKAEARYAVVVKAREMAGEITDVAYQPVFDLVVNGVKVGRYVADFSWTEVATGERVVVDVKGVRTPVFKLKTKLVKAIHGVNVTEVAA